ncbi:hypothetical protein HOG48_06555 [Candidatus Peregrinibacteria bacterium]|jgi:hypothetical protein|nr:hypothetical protein [Candidatus Peregrinibacteria bacterium]
MRSGESLQSLRDATRVQQEVRSLDFKTQADEVAARKAAMAEALEEHPNATFPDDHLDVPLEVTDLFGYMPSSDPEAPTEGNKVLFLLEQRFPGWKERRGAHASFKGDSFSVRRSDRDGFQYRCEFKGQVFHFNIEHGQIITAAISLINKLHNYLIEMLADELRYGDVDERLEWHAVGRAAGIQEMTRESLRQPFGEHRWPIVDEGGRVMVRPELPYKARVTDGRILEGYEAQVVLTDLAKPEIEILRRERAVRPLRVADGNSLTGFHFISRGRPFEISVDMVRPGAPMCWGNLKIVGEDCGEIIIPAAHVVAVGGTHVPSMRPLSRSAKPQSGDEVHWVNRTYFQ